MSDVSKIDFFDIVIIGAGPAGSSAAQAAVKRGANVLMVDRRQRIGVPVQCAEFVPRWISRYVNLSPSCVLQTIESMITHLPDGTSYEMKSPGYMLDRSLFDKGLVASAILSGAKISIETKAVDLSTTGLVVDRGSQKEMIQAKVYIGADGVHSFIARSVGQPLLKTLVALQYEVVLQEPQNHVDVFLDRNYDGGYAWFFPKGRTANAGVGVIPSKISSLPNLLSDFLNFLRESKKVPRVEIVSKTGGSIPCEPYQKTSFKNTLLVGDAAGQAHPITGAGILNAVIGGEIAGRIAAEAISIGDIQYLENYEVEWQERFGKSLSYGAMKRKFLEESWNKPDVDFPSLIKKTWVGFREYYKDRKNLFIPLFKKEGLEEI